MSVFFADDTRKERLFLIKLTKDEGIYDEPGRGQKAKIYQ